ncbi:MAG: hypothetical protein ACF8XB_24705, partial [Planctomycetota bacterium JB042]
MRSALLPLLLSLAFPLLAPDASAQDALTKQAIGRLDKVEGMVATLKDGDVDSANYCLNQLGWAGKR